MIVVGPEEPLVKGLYDYFKSKEELQKIYFIGPSKKGAQLEGSKSFAKEFIIRYKIPTAKYKEFTLDNYEKGVKDMQKPSFTIAVKAGGVTADNELAIFKRHVEA